MRKLPKTPLHYRSPAYPHLPFLTYWSILKGPQHIGTQSYLVSLVFQPLQKCPHVCFYQLCLPPTDEAIDINEMQMYESITIAFVKF